MARQRSCPAGWQYGPRVRLVRMWCERCINSFPNNRNSLRLRPKVVPLGSPFVVLWLLLSSGWGRVWVFDGFLHLFLPTALGQDRQLFVDKWLRVCGVADGSVIALGDCARIQGEEQLPETAQVAAQQGAFVARLLNKESWTWASQSCSCYHTLTVQLLPIASDETDILRHRLLRNMTWAPADLPFCRQAPTLSISFISHLCVATLKPQLDEMVMGFQTTNSCDVRAKVLGSWQSHVLALVPHWECYNSLYLYYIYSALYIEIS